MGRQRRRHRNSGAEFGCGALILAIVVIAIVTQYWYIFVILGSIAALIGIVLAIRNIKLSKNHSLKIVNEEKTFYKPEESSYEIVNADASKILASVNVSVDFVNSTTDPFLFFLHFDNMVQGLQKLTAYRKDIYSKGTSPQIDLDRLLSNKDETVATFIKRCFDFTTAELLKCHKKEEINKISNIYHSINNYREKLSSKNVELYDNLIIDGFIDDAIEFIAEEEVAKKKFADDLADKIIAEQKAAREAEKIKDAEREVARKAAAAKYFADKEAVEKQLEAQMSTGTSKNIYQMFNEDINRELRERNLSVGSQELEPSEPQTSKHFDTMSGQEFEHFCADLLKENGFVNVKVTSGSGDYGVDIFAEKDGITYAIQCKRLNQNVGVQAVQEIFSGKEFYKRHIGAVLTNQYFTTNAKKKAEWTGIVLWDREYLERMLENSIKE